VGDNRAVAGLPAKVSRRRRSPWTILPPARLRSGDNTCVSLSPQPVPEEGAWIFVSHSHQDLRDVRRVRDALEAKGHQPLLFFLKCLDDDAEIDDLIRREIEARQFFLLCDSPNARASRWVQQEVALINKLAGRVSLQLELEEDWEAQLVAIDELSHRATVFISYAASSHTDRDVAGKIAAALRTADYRVFVDIDSIRIGASWKEQIVEALDEAMDNGYLVVLLSPDAVASTSASKSIAWEVEYAMRRRDELGKPLYMVPVIVRDWELTLSLLRGGDLAYWVATARWLDFTTGEFNDNMAKLRSVLTT
jgi:TIR domain